MTPAERALWQCLRNRGIGDKFRRIHIISGFVVDFYCPAARLAIELDGPVHERQPDHDAARTEALMAEGLRVLRFTNDEVLGNIGQVVATIAAAVGEVIERS